MKWMFVENNLFNLFLCYRTADLPMFKLKLYRTVYYAFSDTRAVKVLKKLTTQVLEKLTTQKAQIFNGFSKPSSTSINQQKMRCNRKIQVQTNPYDYNLQKQNSKVPR